MKSNSLLTQSSTITEKPLSVIVDWRVFYEQKGGNFRNLSEIFPRLIKYANITLRSLHRAKHNPIPKGMPLVPIDLPLLLRRFPENALKEKIWGWKLRDFKNSVFHSLYYSLPPNPNLPLVVSFLDVIPELFPELSTGPNFNRLRKRKEFLAKHASRILAISNTTKCSVSDYFQIDPEKIDVASCGVDFPFFSKLISDQRVKEWRDRWKMPHPFILIVGGRESHKNVRAFLEGYSQTNLKRDFHLVLAGEPLSKVEIAYVNALGIDNHITNLVFPTDEELQALYKTAEAFVYPSLCEGFGLPQIEAMAAGTPVALSRTAITLEVAGDSGFYFDPRSPSDMARVVRKAIESGKQCQNVKIGIDRAQQFTWEKAAEDTAKCYQKAWAQGGRKE